MRKQLWMGACMLWGLSMAANALEFRGYFRLGAGNSTSGGTQSCFLLPGAQSKYRLGNECDQWIDLHFRQDVFTLDDGSVFSLEASPQLYNAYGHSVDFTGDNGFARMSQTFAEWSKVPALNGGSFWVGRRLYNRNDINITDYYYWDQSGTGFGVDEYAIGALKLSYVFSRKDSVFQKEYVNRHDVTLGGIAVNPGGELKLGVSYLDKPDQENANSGLAFTVQHVQSGVWGGKNTAAIQYGQGPGTAFGRTGDVHLDDTDTSWRFLDYVDWKASPRLTGQVVALYQKDHRSDGVDQQWASVGIRPVYALTEQIKLITELGHDRVNTTGGTRKLTKFTIAPTWSPKGPDFWARPEVRLYYTYAAWNRAAQRAADETAEGSALSTTGPFGNALHGSNVGVQVEYWWD